MMSATSLNNICQDFDLLGWLVCGEKCSLFTIEVSKSISDYSFCSSLSVNLSNYNCLKVNFLP